MLRGETGVDLHTLAAAALGQVLSDELMDKILALNGSLAADAFGDLLFLRHWDSSNPILKGAQYTPIPFD